MTEYYFSPRQIAEMAMGVEEAGRKFYFNLANPFHKKKLKDIFLNLADAELKHRDIFKSIADSFSKEDESEYSIDLPALMQSYVDKLEGLVFNMKSFSNKPTNVREALNVAVYTEEEAICIYTEIYNCFVDKFHDILTRIIEEEKKHLEILNHVKAEMNCR